MVYLPGNNQFFFSLEQPKRSSHYWLFDSSGSKDLRTGSNVSIFGNGSDVIIEGTNRNYLHLDGSSTVELGPLLSDCLAVPLHCKTGFTLAFWLRIANKSTPCYFVRALHSHNQGFGVLQTASDLRRNLLTFYVMSGNSIWNGSVEIKRNTWNHLVVSWNKSTTLDSYLNGQRKSSTNIRTISVREPEWNLTLNYPPHNIKKNMKSFFYLDGKAYYDNVMIWYYRLTDSETKNVFHKQLGKYYLVCSLLNGCHPFQTTISKL